MAEGKYFGRFTIDGVEYHNYFLPEKFSRALRASVPTSYRNNSTFESQATIRFRNESYLEKVTVTGHSSFISERGDLDPDAIEQILYLGGSGTQPTASQNSEKKGLWRRLLGR